MKRFNEDFPFILKGVDFDTLESNKHSVYAFSKDFELLYFNEAYIDFAYENGINDDNFNYFKLGSNIFEAISGDDLFQFYQENYVRILNTGEIWNNEYECSSSDKFRVFLQRTIPLNNSGILLISNHLVVEKPINEVRKISHKPVLENYVQPTGFITQCCNCRTIQRVNEPLIWDWVPQWVHKMPENTSHSICPVCFDYYWKYGKLNKPDKPKD